MAIPSACRDLSTCGFFRANGARPAAWPVSASFRPLAVHKYGFGAKSCANRLNLPGSAPLAGAKEAACVTLMSCGGSSESSRPAPFAASPLPPSAGRSAARDFVGEYAFSSRLRLVSAVRRTATPRLSPPAARPLPRSRTRLSAPLSRLTAGQRKKKLCEEQAEKPSVELSETHGLGSADSPRSASRTRSGIPRQRPATRYGDEAAGRDPRGERERDRGFEDRDELDQGDKRDRVGEARLAAERG